MDHFLILRLELRLFLLWLIIGHPLVEDGLTNPFLCCQPPGFTWITIDSILNCFSPAVRIEHLCGPIGKQL